MSLPVLSSIKTLKAWLSESPGKAALEEALADEMANQQRVSAIKALEAALLALPELMERVEPEVEEIEAAPTEAPTEAAPVEPEPLAEPEPEPLAEPLPAVEPPPGYIAWKWQRAENGLILIVTLLNSGDRALYGAWMEISAPRARSWPCSPPSGEGIVDLLAAMRGGHVIDLSWVSSLV